MPINTNGLIWTLRKQLGGFKRSMNRRLVKPVKFEIAMRRSLASQEREINDGLSALESRFSRASFPQNDPEHSIVRDENIPQLAWLCRRSLEGGYEATIGRSVEQFPNGFFEGVWGGDFTDLGTAANSESYGSGLLFDQAHPLFIGRKDVREHIFILRDKQEGVDYISNTFCFILARAEVAVDDPLFEALNTSLVSSTHSEGRKGFHRADPKVAETDRYEFYRIYYSNFRFRPDGTVSFEQPFLGKDFRDYADYKSFLLDLTKKVFENGAHPNRAKPLTPLTSLSSGYDSTGVSVLARDCGCTEAVTLRVSVYKHQDSGEPVASALGLNIKPYTHVAGEKISNLEMVAQGPLRDRAIEFIATPGIGDDITFASFEPELEGRILLTGVGGDGTWDVVAEPSVGMPIDFRFARSLIEYRLRVGFAHYGPILAASVCQGPIVRVSRGAEMKPFRIGGRYDRPIPRRLAEEAGVPREAFGMKKSATAPNFTDARRLWKEAVAEIMQRYQ